MRSVHNHPALHNLKGQFIIASPALDDPNFVHGVVLVLHHDTDGAVGLIVNRALELTIEQAWSNISDLPCLVTGPLHQGGPCEGPLMVLHTGDAHAQFQTPSGISCTTNRNDIEDLVAANIDERPLKFFVNYSGWGEGQLESEIREGAWLIAPASLDQVFSLTGETLWRRLMNRAALMKANPWLRPEQIPDDPSNN